MDFRTVKRSRTRRRNYSYRSGDAFSICHVSGGPIGTDWGRNGRRWCGRWRSRNSHCGSEGSGRWTSSGIGRGPWRGRDGRASSVGLTQARKKQSPAADAAAAADARIKGNSGTILIAMRWISMKDRSTMRISPLDTRWFRRPLKPPWFECGCYGNGAVFYGHDWWAQSFACTHAHSRPETKKKNIFHIISLIIFKKNLYLFNIIAIFFQMGIVKKIFLKEKNI